jgi:ADP-ribose pyrophosphatase YjhB (NUDIX family)
LAGKFQLVDPKKNETALQAAIRESREEAGITAEYWHQLPRQIENVGRGNSRSDLFVAAGIISVQNKLDVGEVITDQRWFPVYEVEDMMLDGRINAGHTLASLALANTFVNRNPDHPIAKRAG